MSPEETTLPLSDLEHCVPHRVLVGGVPVALVRIDDDVYAIGDICSHAEVSLSGGEVYETRQVERTDLGEPAPVAAAAVDDE